MYKGMAVGGPLAGNSLESESPEYYHHIPLKTTARFDPYAPISSSPSENRAVYHHSIGLRGALTIDIWLHERMTLEQALNEVFHFYHKHAKKDAT